MTSRLTACGASRGIQLAWRSSQPQAPDATPSEAANALRTDARGDDADGDIAPHSRQQSAAERSRLLSSSRGSSAAALERASTSCCKTTSAEGHVPSSRRACSETISTYPSRACRSSRRRTALRDRVGVGEGLESGVQLVRREARVGEHLLQLWVPVAPGQRLTHSIRLLSRQPVMRGSRPRRVPRSGVLVGPLGPVAKLGGGARWAVERDRGRVAHVRVGVVAPERSPTAAELVARAGALHTPQQPCLPHSPLASNSASAPRARRATPATSERDGLASAMYRSR
jgi:hypothetical protein